MLFNFDIKKLRSKLHLIYSPMPSFNTTALGIFIKTGARNEPQEYKGIAHFLEHMIFKGSKKYSYKKIKQEIEGRGGYLNGYTSQELTCYYTYSLKKNLFRNLDILLDMIFYPKLEEREIEKERNVIFEEIKMYNDSPQDRVFSILDSLLWENHPLGRDVIGSMETVKKVTRKQLIDFQRNFYTPPHILVSVAGDIKEDEDKIEDFINGKIGGKFKDVSSILKSPQEDKQFKIQIEKKEQQQFRLALGFRSYSYLDNRRFIVDILTTILGGNMSSRLFESLREKKALVYDVYSEARKYSDTGAIIIHFGLDKNNIKEALTIIYRELNELKNNFVSTRELSRAKDYIWGNMSIRLENVQDRMGYLGGSYIRYGKVLSLEELQEYIYSVDKKSIREVANDVFDFRSMKVAIVGPFPKDKGEEENFREEIKGIFMKKGG